MSASDRYEVFESLGQNDYLIVHRGWDRKLRRPVAIMELEKRFRAKEQQYDRVWNEVLAVAGLEHQGFVRVYEVVKENGWIVTELMTGTLTSQISTKGLSSREVRGVLRTSLEAMEYLHERDKLHGDIRPANLLIDDEGHVRLSHPVGLAVGGQVPRRTMNQKYLAPELVKPEFGEAGKQTDLYCLGFTAFELLAGPVFDDLFKSAHVGGGVNAAAGLSWLRYHASDKPLPSVKEVVPGVADDIATTIDKLVRKHVRERIGSAGEALTLLANGDDEEVMFVTEPTVAPRERRETSDIPRIDRRRPLAPESRTARRSVASTGAKPWTTAWAREKLSDPSFFRMFAGVVLAGAVVAGLGLQALMSPAEGNSASLANISGLDPVGTPLQAPPLPPFTEPTVEVDRSLADKVQQLQLSVDSLAQSRVSDSNAILADIRQLTQNLADSREEPDLPNYDLPDISASLLSLENAIKELEASTRGNNAQQRELVDALAVLKSQLARYEVGISESAPKLTPPLQPTEPPQGFDPKDNQGILEPELSQPVSADALAGAATRKSGVGDFAGAIADIEAAMKADPSNMAAWRKIAFDVHMAMGLDRIGAQANVDAVQAFSTALSYAETSVQKGRATGNRSVAYLRCELVDAAIRDFETALQFDASLANQWSSELASAYRFRGMESFRNREHKSAEADLTTAIRLGNSDGETLATLAACQFQERNFQDSATTFEQAFEQSGELVKPFGPMAADAFYRRGLQLTEANPNAAIAEFTKSITLHPTKFDAIVARAELYRLATNWNRAKDDYSIAINLQDEPSLFAGRAVCQLQLREPDSALIDYEKAVKGGHSFEHSDRLLFAKAFVERGIRNFDAKRFDDAIIDCQKAIRLDRQYADAPMLSGTAQLKLGDFKAALEDFDKAISLSRSEQDDRLPKDVVLIGIYGRGTANLELGRYDLAERDFDQVISVAPDFATAHLKRGIALEQLAKHQEALESFDEAIRLENGSYSAFNNRGACLLNLHEYADAIRDLTRAIQINNKGANAYYNRSIAYRRLKMDSKANADLVKALQFDPNIENESTQ